MFAVPPDRWIAGPLQPRPYASTDPAEAPNGPVDIPELSPRYAGSRGQNRTDAWSANRCPPPGRAASRRRVNWECRLMN